jgi:hypothetical protein
MSTLLTGKSLEVLTKKDLRGAIEPHKHGGTHHILDERKMSVFSIFGEGAFENGNPAEKHYGGTPDQASEEHSFQNVLAPKH